jgi:hypothetical protein
VSADTARQHAKRARRFADHERREQQCWSTVSGADQSSASDR